MKSILLLFIFFIGIIHIHAQDKQYLSTPMEIFSKKKTAYITTNDGTEFQGTIDKLKKKKGLIEYVRLNLESGTEKEFLASDIFAFSDL